MREFPKCPTAEEEPYDHRKEMIAITLRRIMACGPCYDPIKKGILEKGHDLDAPISFRWLAQRIPPRDVIWCFANLPAEHDCLKRNFAVDCAERVRHLMTDERSLSALAVARKHALGEASDEELRAACETAWDAARDVARATAWAAASDAAWATAWAACETARAAASDAAWATAWDTCEAALAASETARATAWDAASETAWATARATAWDAAWAAELRWQVQRILEITETGEWSPVGENK